MAAATFACRQLVGIEDGPPQGPPASTDSGALSTDAGSDAAFTYGLGDCETCVAIQCSAQSAACAVLPSCSALETCMGACNEDPTCRAQCGVTCGLGNDVATPAFEACLASQCATACGISCGGLAATFPPATAPACQSCIATNACPAVTACARDPQCQGALRCRFSSDTLDVQQACPQLPGPDGGTGASLFSQNPPIATPCSSACSWGADWSCVGRVDWPPATVGTGELTASVYDELSQAPVGGALLKLCNTQDLTCATPFATATTGDAGVVTLTRAPVQGPLLFYLDVSSPAIVPALAFDVFPVSEPRISIPVPTLPQVELTLLAAGIPGLTVNPQLGTVLVIAVDCRLSVAAGVQVSLTPTGSAGPFYFVNNLPSPEATATDPTGVVAFFNVPVSPTPLELTVTPQGLGLAAGKIAFFVRPGGVSEVYAVPTPTP